MKAQAISRPGRTGAITTYLLIAAETLRILTAGSVQARLAWYLALVLGYVVLYTAVLLRPRLPRLLAQLYFAVQSAIVLALLAPDPRLDFVTLFFLMLSYLVPFLLDGRARWVWIGIFVVLTLGPLMLFHGGLEGLALGLTNTAAIIVIPALVIVNQEIERARAGSEAMLKELEATHARLEAYASQVEELAALEERGRLARELHDSVSQTMFGITLTTRSIQLLLEREPARARAQLEQLQTMTQNALVQMRSLIAELRPPNA